MLLGRRDALDTVLGHWARDDPLTLRDWLRGTAIFGQTGSGKSSGSGLTLARAIANYRNSGGCVLASKPEDRKFWENVFRSAGRSRDLIAFGPKDDQRFNFLDFVGGDAKNACSCLLTMGEILQGGRSDGGGDSASFFRSNKERALECAIRLLRMAYGRISAPDIEKFILDAALNAKQLDSDDWKGGFHATTLVLAARKPKDQIEQFDFEHAKDLWLSEWPTMADKTRSGIIADIMGVLHPLNSGIVRLLCSTNTTVSPAVMDGGKWVMVDMNIDDYGDSARVVLGGWKFLTQLHILKRQWSPEQSPITIWCDEAQEVVEPGTDARYLSKCRSHGGTLVYLCQSIHSYFSAMPGVRGQSQAKSLLSNFYQTVWHQLGDPESAAYASAMLGQELQVMTGGSEAPGGTLGSDMFGISNFTASFNQQWTPILQPNAFMSGLRSGGPKARYKVDSWLIREGIHRFVTFDQR